MKKIEENYQRIEDDQGHIDIRCRQSQGDPAILETTIGLIMITMIAILVSYLVWDFLIETIFKYIGITMAIYFVTRKNRFFNILGIVLCFPLAFIPKRIKLDIREHNLSFKELVKSTI
jgi:hypothetical protein